MDNMVLKLKVAEALIEGESIAQTDNEESDTDSDRIRKRPKQLPSAKERKCQRCCQQMQ